MVNCNISWFWSSYVLRKKRKGEPMSRYGDSDYDDMFYELDEFLKSHKPSELLKLVQEAVEWWEEEEREEGAQE